MARALNHFSAQPLSHPMMRRVTNLGIFVIDSERTNRTDRRQTTDGFTRDDEHDVDDDDIDREGIVDGGGGGEDADQDWGNANAANNKDSDGFEEASEDATDAKTVGRDQGERWELDRVANV